MKLPQVLWMVAWAALLLPATTSAFCTEPAITHHHHHHHHRASFVVPQPTYTATRSTVLPSSLSLLPCIQSRTTSMLLRNNPRSTTATRLYQSQQDAVNTAATFLLASTNILQDETFRLLAILWVAFGAAGGLGVYSIMKNQLQNALYDDDEDEDDNDEKQQSTSRPAAAVSPTRRSSDYKEKEEDDEWGMGRLARMFGRGKQTEEDKKEEATPFYSGWAAPQSPAPAKPESSTSSWTSSRTAAATTQTTMTTSSSTSPPSAAAAAAAAATTSPSTPAPWTSSRTTSPPATTTATAPPSSSSSSLESFVKGQASKEKTTPSTTYLDARNSGSGSTGATRTTTTMGRSQPVATSSIPPAPVSAASTTRLSTASTGTTGTGTSTDSSSSSSSPADFSISPGMMKGASSSPVKPSSFGPKAAAPWKSSTPASAGPNPFGSYLGSMPSGGSSDDKPKETPSYPSAPVPAPMASTKPAPAPAPVSSPPAATTATTTTTSSNSTPAGFSVSPGMMKGASGSSSSPVKPSSFGPKAAAPWKSSTPASAGPNPFGSYLGSMPSGGKSKETPTYQSAPAPAPMASTKPAPSPPPVSSPPATMATTTTTTTTSSNNTPAGFSVSPGMMKGASGSSSSSSSPIKPSSFGPKAAAPWKSSTPASAGPNPFGSYLGSMPSGGSSDDKSKDTPTYPSAPAPAPMASTKPAPAPVSSPPATMATTTTTTSSNNTPAGFSVSPGMMKGASGSSSSSSPIKPSSFGPKAAASWKSSTPAQAAPNPFGSYIGSMPSGGSSDDKSKDTPTYPSAPAPAPVASTKPAPVPAPVSSPPASPVPSPVAASKTSTDSPAGFSVSSGMMKGASGSAKPSSFGPKSTASWKTSAPASAAPNPFGSYLGSMPQSGDKAKETPTYTSAPVSTPSAAPSTTPGPGAPMMKDVADKFNRLFSFGSNKGDQRKNGTTFSTSNPTESTPRDSPPLGFSISPGMMKKAFSTAKSSSSEPKSTSSWKPSAPAPATSNPFGSYLGSMPSGREVDKSKDTPTFPMTPPVTSTPPAPSPSPQASTKTMTESTSTESSRAGFLVSSGMLKEASSTVKRSSFGPKATPSWKTSAPAPATSNPFDSYIGSMSGSNMTIDTSAYPAASPSAPAVTPAAPKTPSPAGSSTTSGTPSIYGSSSAAKPSSFGSQSFRQPEAPRPSGNYPGSSREQNKMMETSAYPAAPSPARTPASARVSPPPAPRAPSTPTRSVSPSVPSSPMYARTGAGSSPRSRASQIYRESVGPRGSDTYSGQSTRQSKPGSPPPFFDRYTSFKNLGPNATWSEGPSALNADPSRKVTREPDSSQSLPFSDRYAKFKSLGPDATWREGPRALNVDPAVASRRKAPPTEKPPFFDRYAVFKNLGPSSTWNAPSARSNNTELVGPRREIKTGENSPFRLRFAALKELGPSASWNEGPSFKSGALPRPRRESNVNPTSRSGARNNSDPEGTRKAAPLPLQSPLPPSSFSLRYAAMKNLGPAASWREGPRTVNQNGTRREVKATEAASAFFDRYLELKSLGPSATWRERPRAPNTAFVGPDGEDNLKSVGPSATWSNAILRADNTDLEGFNGYIP